MASAPRWMRFLRRVEAKIWIPPVVGLLGVLVGLAISTGFKVYEIEVGRDSATSAVRRAAYVELLSSAQIYADGWKDGLDCAVSDGRYAVIESSASNVVANALGIQIVAGTTEASDIGGDIRAKVKEMQSEVESVAMLSTQQCAAAQPIVRTSHEELQNDLANLIEALLAAGRVDIS